MIHRHFIIFCLFAIVSSLRAQEPPEEVVRVTIRPAATPVPALKYQFLPEVRDLISGNALIHYHRAVLLAGKPPGPDDKYWNWVVMQTKELPRDEVRSYLQRYRQVFRELGLAARCDHCDWQFRERARTDAFSALLPDVQQLRDLANLLKLQAQLEIVDGHFTEAVRTLRLGYTMAKHANQADTLISSLVGAAIAQLMTDQTTELLQIPGAPNLYWALTDLPRPFIDLRTPMQAERLMVNGLFPLQEGDIDVRTTPLSIDQLQERLEHLMGDRPHERTQFRLALIAITAKGYPEAKRYLLSEGLPAETVEAMPRFQVVLLFALAEYNRLFDEMLKWQGLPYWQARPGLEKAMEGVREEKIRAGELERIPLAALLIPAVHNVVFATTRIDRKVAALRCIEAIRLYNAGHEGKFPGALTEITEVPIPIDPVTGKDFEYKMEDGKAVLAAPPPAGQKPHSGNNLKYELTLAK
jgi:hypothetical protein